jgi:hypothetical protein
MIIRCDGTRASSSSPLPPVAAFLGSLDLVQLPLEPRHQIFGDPQPGLFLAEIGLNLGDAFLCGLAFPANMICLLLQGATVENFPLQRSLVGGRPAS